MPEASPPDPNLWRDSSGRLTFDLPGFTANDYPAVCRCLADGLGLTPKGELIIGLEQMFWDFARGDQTVGLDWDIWMDFMVVAQTDKSEPLVHEIAAWLRANNWRAFCQ